METTRLDGTTVLTIPTVPAAEQEWREAQRIELQSTPFPVLSVSDSQSLEIFAGDLFRASHHDLTNADID